MSAALLDHYGVPLSRESVSYAPAEDQVAFWEAEVARQPWSSAARTYLERARGYEVRR